MIETIFFIAGTVLGSIISWISFRSGSSNAHQAYDIVYSPVPEPTKKDEGTKTTDTTSELYDWDEYTSSMKWQQFEKDDSKLDEKPN